MAPLIQGEIHMEESSHLQQAYKVFQELWKNTYTKLLDSCIENHSFTNLIGCCIVKGLPLLFLPLSLPSPVAP